MIPEDRWADRRSATHRLFQLRFGEAPHVSGLKPKRARTAARRAPLTGQNARVHGFIPSSAKEGEREMTGADAGRVDRLRARDVARCVSGECRRRLRRSLLTGQLDQQCRQIESVYDRLLNEAAKGRQKIEPRRAPSRLLNAGPGGVGKTQGARVWIELDG